MRVHVALLLVAMTLKGVPALSEVREQQSAIDFAYYFATPHRVTVGRPDHSERTLVDLQPGMVRLSWSFEDLRNYPAAAFKTPPTQWGINLTPQIDGRAFAGNGWRRIDGWIPSVVSRFTDAEGSLTLQVVGGISGAIGRVEMANLSNTERRFTLRCESTSWGENPGWMEPEVSGADHLNAGWNERADRVLFVAQGAERWSDRPDKRPPSPKIILMEWALKPGESRVAWVARPYRAHTAELERLRHHLWRSEFDVCVDEWRRLIARAARPEIPDEGVVSAYRACVADLFIMREPAAGGNIASVPGTEAYRAANTHEAAISAITLDQLGMPREAERGYRLPLELQEADGNWEDNRGWGHSMWSCSGFKSWFIMTHFRLTENRDYLARNYPRMLAASRWREKQRQRSRVLVDGKRPLTWGLMPRGFGDCGLWDGDDMYGVFIPHNIWAVYADRMALEAARILARYDEVAELEPVVKQATADLVEVMERGSIAEGDYRWIPGVAGKTSGSLWGGLNALTPCEILAPDHPLIEGTIRHMESRLSPGGIPMHTGWLADGMWVAITLDNLASAHLRRGNGDAAARYLRAVLNHGTPLYTWCEERGPEKGSAHCTGDRQHLWTPIAVARALRDMFATEQPDGLHLAMGVDRDWVGTGQTVGIQGVATDWGELGYTMRLDREKLTLGGQIRFARRRRAIHMTMHLRLPDGYRAVGMLPRCTGELSADGTTIVWHGPTGALQWGVRLERADGK